ncbi:MAG: septal ring lytic transglycosylase RlpA family protein [Actinobacteria bacterium]|nr:septal ring lytic transglycosylase RlpA family protein [Actinomycetota bacterium]
MGVQVRVYKNKSIHIKALIVAAIVLSFSMLFYGMIWFRNYSQLKKIVLRIDDKRVVIKTNSRNVAELLRKEGVFIAPADLVKPSENTLLVNNMKIEIRRAVPLSLEIDGEKSSIVTTARTVKDLLEKKGIAMTPQDKVNPPVDSEISRGMEIQAVRILEKIESVKTPIAFKTLRKRDDALPRGQIKVDIEGKEGFVEKSYKVTYEGGREIKREFLSEAVTSPTNKVVKIGSRRIILASRGEGRNEEPNQPSQGKSQEGIASYYTLNGKGIGMAAAHRTLPFGTVVTVTNLSNGKQVVVRINDRGPWGKGRIIDLATDAFRQIASTSQGLALVKIEW